MFNFDFKRSSRKCSISGREFDVGEEYVSALMDIDGELVRQDIGCDQWNESQDNCIGWWKSRVPDLTKGQVYWAPRDVLVSYFKRLLEQKDERDKAYVMAILLLQKKTLKLLDTTAADEGDIMQLMENSSRERFEVPVVDLTEDQINQIQAEFAEKLFTDVAPTQD